MRSTITDRFVNIRVARPDDVRAVIAAAAADNHASIAPTHLVSKGKEIVGYVSLGAVPLAFWWMHSQKTDVIDSVQVANFMENITAAAGARDLVVPVPVTSPYLPLMKKAGYLPFGENMLFHKNIGG